MKIETYQAARMALFRIGKIEDAIEATKGMKSFLDREITEDPATTESIRKLILDELEKKLAAEKKSFEAI